MALDGALGTVAGWRVAATSDTHVLMAAAGRLVECRLLVQRRGGQVRMVTAMRYRRWAGRLAWAVLSPRHRALAPWLLRQAAASLRSSA